MVELIAVPSAVHLKTKYYTTEGLLSTLHGDVQAARRCFEAAAKGLSSISTQPRAANKPTLPSSYEELKRLPHVDTIDLENRFTKDDLK